MLTTLFQKRSLFYLYRLTKPNISQFKSIQDLQYDQKERELALIQQINSQTLRHNKNYTKQKQISQLLRVSEQISKNICQKNIKFTGVLPNSRKIVTLQQNIKDGKIDLPFLSQQSQPNFPDFNRIPIHFSYNRGIPIIPEYQMDKKIAYVFNLPENINEKQISQNLGIETIKQIKIEQCRLGLPAYAKVYFNSDEAVTNLVLSNKTYVELKDRICFIKTHFDKEKLELKNRRLIIQNVDKNQQNLIVQLSKYGRIIHFDFPQFVTRNVSLEEVRQKYRNSDTLVKINVHRKDGSIDSEYYPSIQQCYKMSTINTPIDFEANLAQKRQKQKAAYRNRMRYAPQVNVYEGKQNQISVNNMGFCIVTYSCTQQTQNAYFNLRLQNKVKLFDSKVSEIFEFDEGYRKRVLRFIDAQHRKAKQFIQNSKTLYQKQEEQYNSELGLFDRLVDFETQQKALRQTKDYMYDQEPEVLISEFKTRFNEIKSQLCNKLGSKSFQQMAQQELFGRVLPKQNPKKPKIGIDVLPERSQEFKQILHSDNLESITSKNIQNRDTYYSRKRSRSSRRKNLDLEKQFLDDNADNDKQGQQGQNYVDADVEGDDYTGKRGFSTIKRKTVAFRTRTPVEQANYILRYAEYIKNIMNEYQGVFPESRLKPNISYKSSFLNPQHLRFADGNQFITQQDLPKILQCMRDFSEASTNFDQYWKDLQIFKSKNLNVESYRNLVQNNGYQAIQKYFDTGVVKEVYQVEEGQDTDAKVNLLNATVANFGQQFRCVTQNNQKVIVKIAKLQNIYPLEKLTRVNRVKSKYEKQNGLTQKQQKTLQKLKTQMLESGQIPKQIREQFNIQNDKTLDDLFVQLASEAGIYKKDLETILNIGNYTKQQIGEDIGLQIQLQKVRLAQKQSHVNDYAKDPSNIQIRDREGYFKVSKFRQI